jgi:hypothetical protein
LRRAQGDGEFHALQNGRLITNYAFTALRLATWKAGAAIVPLHHGGLQGAKPKAVLVADILASIRERRA